MFIEKLTKLLSIEKNAWTSGISLNLDGFNSLMTRVSTNHRRLKWPSWVGLVNCYKLLGVIYWTVYISYRYTHAQLLVNCSWCTAQVLHWVIGENIAIEQRVDLSRGESSMGRFQIFPTIFGCGWAGGTTTAGTRNGGWSTVVTRHNASRWVSGAAVTGTRVALKRPAGCFGFLKGW